MKQQKEIHLMEFKASLTLGNMVSLSQPGDGGEDLILIHPEQASLCCEAIMAVANVALSNGRESKP